MPIFEVQFLCRVEYDRLKYCFDQFYPNLCLYAHKYVQDIEVAKDIAQDAFIKCWDRLSDFDADAALKVFLYRTVTNESLNYLKHRKVEIEAHSILLEEEYMEEHFLENEVYLWLRRVIHELPPQGKRIIELSLEGARNPEIAENLGVSLNTVKTIKQKAYKTLREKLSKAEIFLFYQIYSRPGITLS
ncbi:RNA polymerase sigma-70 factor [Puteibacter caeruleilacunae]|nr:RNA polymerase sigma-70 factor [Puteibacter caeruleilacunae]